MPLRFRILPAPAEVRVGWVHGGGDAAPWAEGPTDERTFEMPSELDEVRIGRRPGIEIELPFPSVSLVHTRLFRGQAPGDWWAEDLGSTNGTWLDGLRLDPGRPRPLRPGQRLRIATVDIVFEGWSATPRGAESTASLARRLISDLFGVVGGDVPTLTVELGPARQPMVRLVDRDRRYLAGRSDGCDLVLPSEHVSREHAVFVRRWDGVVASDLGSKNGVFVNAVLLPECTRLADGDRIQVGPVVLRFTDPEDRYLRRLESLGKDVAGFPAPGTPPRAAAGTGAASAGTPGTPPRAAAGTGAASAGTPAGVTRTPAQSPSSESRPHLLAGPLARESEPPEAVAGVIAAATPEASPSGRPGRRPRVIVAVLAVTIVVVAVAGLIVLLMATR